MPVGQEAPATAPQAQEGQQAEVQPSAREIGETLNQQALAVEREKYIRQFGEIVDGVIAPTTPLSGMLKDAVDRLRANEGYMQQVDWVRASLRDVGQKLVDAAIARERALLGAKKLTVERLRELETTVLSGSTQKFKSMGESFKIRRTPYEDATKESSPDVMETEELMLFGEWVSKMQSVDGGELIDMLQDDAEFFQMMAEEQDSVESGLLCPPEPPAEGASQQELDEFDRRQEFYKGNMKKLVQFILGVTPEKQQPEKPTLRKTAENIVWQEIVRSLDLGQKSGLIKAYFLETKDDVAKTRTFIASCIITGVMTREELLRMKESPDATVRETIEKLGPDFDKFLVDAVNAKDLLRGQIQLIVGSAEMKPIMRGTLSFATFACSFPVVFADTLGRTWGAATALVNAIGCITDRINARGEGSTMGAIALGCKDAVLNPYVIGGTAAAIVATNIVYPWWGDWIRSPSSGEKEKIGRYREMEFMRNLYNDKPKAMDYFVAHYESYLKSARVRQNEEVENPRTHQKEPRKFDIYPGDLTREDLTASASNPANPERITPKIAGESGFKSPREMEAAMIRLFGICTRAFENEQLTHADKLDDFLHKKVYGAQIVSRQRVPQRSPQIQPSPSPI